MKHASTALLLAAALPALADDGPWLRCRALTEAAARLACYDAVRPAGATATGPVTSPSASAAATTPPSVAASAEARFGAEQRPGDELIEIRSVLPGRFEGWGPRQTFRLANGQTWQSSDSSRGYYVLESPQVRIRRGALGSFLLEIEGVNQVIRVRRIQ